MPTDHSLLSATNLSQRLREKISQEPVLVQRILDRWIGHDLRAVRKMEHAGTLLKSLTEQASLEQEALESMAGEQYSHLSDHEKLQLAGPPLLP
ncbi:MAG: hypothetical protein ACKVP5_05710 [Aestuariivirga sp.]